MHICYITSEFPKQGFPHGGAGTFIATIAKALVEKGISVSDFTLFLSFFKKLQNCWYTKLLSY